MKELTFNVSPKRAANILKQFINNNCEEGFKWYEIDDEPTVSIMDILVAIQILEEREGKNICITDIPENEEDYMKVIKEIGVYND